MLSLSLSLLLSFPLSLSLSLSLSLAFSLSLPLSVYLSVGLSVCLCTVCVKRQQVYVLLHCTYLKLVKNMMVVIVGVYRRAIKD